jgi:hypothetical protein
MQLHFNFSVTRQRKVTDATMQFLVIRLCEAASAGGVY